MSVENGEGKGKGSGFHDRAPCQGQGSHDQVPMSYGNVYFLQHENLMYSEIAICALFNKICYTYNATLLQDKLQGIFFFWNY